MPVALSPAGLTAMQHAEGEMLAARATKAFGVPLTLSTMSICSKEDVSQAVGGHPLWFQLYVMKDRAFVESLIDRAKARGRTALMVTLDAQLVGQRNQDIRNIDGMAEWAASQHNADLKWSDIAWIKRRWGGKLILKGILDADDARLAVSCGADALVVFNHGGH